MASITIGGRVYTKAQAIAWLDQVGKDKSHDDVQLTRVGQAECGGRQRLELRRQHDRVRGCVDGRHPVGSGVSAASLAWRVGEPLHRQMDNYNNGMLCAPHRD